MLSSKSDNSIDKYTSTLAFVTVSFLVVALPFLALAAGFFLMASPLGAIGPGSPYLLSRWEVVIIRGTHLEPNHSLVVVG